MYPCNRGEILTRSVHEKAANRTAVIKTRAHVFECADRFIAHRSSGGTQLCASNFPGTARALACCDWCRRQSTDECHALNTAVHWERVRGEAPRTTREAHAV